MGMAEAENASISDLIENMTEESKHSVDMLFQADGQRYMDTAEFVTKFEVFDDYANLLQSARQEHTKQRALWLLGGSSLIASILVVAGWRRLRRRSTPMMQELVGPD